MAALFVRVVRVAFVALLAGFAIGAMNISSDLTLSVARSDPGLTANLAKGQPLYIAVDYDSGVSFRLHAKADATGATAESQITNPSILHPAGHGTALVWVSFEGPAKADRITVTAYDGEGNVVSLYNVAADLTWTGEGTAPAAPAWVSDLRKAEAGIDAGLATPATGFRAIAGIVFACLAVVAVPGYILLQVLAIVRLEQDWKLAAIVPMLVMIPVALHAIYALSHNSNLWMIVVSFTSPVACLYLAGLFLVRHFSGRPIEQFPPPDDTAADTDVD